LQFTRSAELQPVLQRQFPARRRGGAYRIDTGWPGGRPRSTGPGVAAAGPPASVQTHSQDSLADDEPLLCRHTGVGGCNPIDRLQPVSRKPGRFGELLWYRLRKHKLSSVQKLFFWTRDSRDRTKLLRNFPWAELDYILVGRCPEQNWFPAFAGKTRREAELNRLNGLEHKVFVFVTRICIPSHKHR